MRIALIGFGHVGRAVARLLIARQDRLPAPIAVTAIVTGRHGALVDERGIDLERAIAAERFADGASPAIGALPADVVVELTPLDARTGGPALAHVRDALAGGRHVVTANKGPIALAYRELAALAREHDVILRFEATVADCLPVFDLARSALPLAEIASLRGVLSSTTNHILSAAARGVPFAAALAEAQRLGIAEADPRNDLEGWDAAAKATILANVLMGADLRPADVRRVAVDERAAEAARDAAADGDRVRPVVEIARHGAAVVASAGPVRIGPDDPLHAVDGFSMGLVLDTDLAGRVAVQLHAPHVEQTAYAVLTDLLDIAAMRT
jgi:homoserine dehydrogenase